MLATDEKCEIIEETKVWKLQTKTAEKFVILLQHMIERALDNNQCQVENN